MKYIKYKKGTKFLVHKDNYEKGLDLVENEDLLVLHDLSIRVIDPQGKVLKRCYSEKHKDDLLYLQLPKDVTITINYENIVAYLSDWNFRVFNSYKKYVCEPDRLLTKLISLSSIFISNGKVIKNMYNLNNIKSLEDLAHTLNLCKIVSNEYQFYKEEQ